MRENRIEDHFIKRAHTLGAFTCKFTSPGLSGVPDRIIIHRGLTWYVELKAPGEEPRPLQSFVHGLMRAAGAKIITLDTIEKVDRFFKTHII